MITQKHKHNMGLRGFQFYTTSPRGISPPPWQAADHPNSQWIRPLEEEGIVSLINFLTGVKVELKPSFATVMRIAKGRAYPALQ